MKNLCVFFTLISLILFITGCGLVNKGTSSNVDFGKDDYKKIISANNHLGFELLSNVEANADGNIFISPTSLFMALSMIYNGSDEVTKEEIAKVLHVEGMDANSLNKANASMMSILQSDSKQIQLNIANSIWLNNNFHFQAEFAQNNKDYFNANIQEIDISASKSPKMINDWVKKSTNNKVLNIFLWEVKIFEEVSAGNRAYLYLGCICLFRERKFLCR